MWFGLGQSDWPGGSAQLQVPVFGWGCARHLSSVARPQGNSDQLASALSRSVHHDRRCCLSDVVKPVLRCPCGSAWSGWQVTRWLACWPRLACVWLSSVISWLCQYCAVRRRRRLVVGVRACSLTVPSLIVMLPVSDRPGNSSVLLGGQLRMPYIWGPTVCGVVVDCPPDPS